MSSLKTYLSKFSTLHPQLVELLNPKGTDRFEITHRWSTDSYHTCGWSEGETPTESPEEENRTLSWSPEFTLRGENYTLSGRLDDDGFEPYWVLDLKVFEKTPLHNRTGFRGPYKTLCVHDILEQDLPNLPSFLSKP